MATERGKTICFIDNANIFHGQRDEGWKIDWQKLRDYLEQDGEIWQTYFFASYNDPMESEQEAFFHFLKENLRWEIKLYPLGKRTLTCRKCEYTTTQPVEKGVDVGIATKMLTLAMNQAYETAILVAGDRDYLETVQFIKGLGLRVEIISWRDGLSDDLASESSAPVVYINDLRGAVERT